MMEMSDLLLRFLLGGVVVSCFAMLGEVLQPKRFAGLFGAAPSVALATVPLTIHRHGAIFASVEARSMVASSLAFTVYAYVVSRVLVRFRPSTLVVTIAALPVWFGVSFGLWAWVLR